MAVTPRLADVRCSRINPGDRLLVQTTHRLDADAERKLRRTIQRWAGCEVSVYVYCVLDMNIKVDR